MMVTFLYIPQTVIPFVLYAPNSFRNFFFQEKERQNVKDARIREMAMSQKQKMQLKMKSNGMLKR